MINLLYQGKENVNNMSALPGYITPCVLSPFRGGGDCVPQ